MTQAPARYSSTPEERSALEKMGVRFDAPSIARKPLPDGRRRPLGLAIVDGPDDRPSPRNHEATAEAFCAESVAGLGEDADRPATLRDIFMLAMKQAIETSFDDRDFVQEVVDKLRAEHAAEIRDLKAALQDARHELRELKLIQESMRIANRGERGVDGARGIPGRDGQQGPIGPRGEKGDSGPRPAGFILNVEDFSAVLALGDSSPGPRLPLRPFFEAYNNQVEGGDA